MGVNCSSWVPWHPISLTLNDLARFRQILKIGENAVVEVASAWGGMTSLVELEAQVRHQYLRESTNTCTPFELDQTILRSCTSIGSTEKSLDGSWSVSCSSERTYFFARGSPQRMAALRSIIVLCIQSATLWEAKLPQQTRTTTRSASLSRPSPRHIFSQANRIGRISPDIGQMLQLQRLDLRRNSIEELPATIGLLTK